MLPHDACNLTCRLRELPHTLLTHGRPPLGGIVEVSADLGFVCFDIDIDARVVCPLYKEKLSHGSVMFLADGIREEELRAPPVGVKQSTMKALEHGIVGDDRVEDAVPAVSDDRVSLGIVGHAPIVETQTRSRAALVVQRNDGVHEKLGGDDAGAQQLLELNALSLLEPDVHHVSVRTDGCRCKAHEGTDRLRGHGVWVELGDLLVGGIGLATTRRAMTTAQEGGWGGKVSHL